MLIDISQVINRCNEAGIETVYDVMEMEDDDRTKLLQMTSSQMYVDSITDFWRFSLPLT